MRQSAQSRADRFCPHQAAWADGVADHSGRSRRITQSRDMVRGLGNLDERVFQGRAGEADGGAHLLDCAENSQFRRRDKDPCRGNGLNRSRAIAKPFFICLMLVFREPFLAFPNPQFFQNDVTRTLGFI